MKELVGRCQECQKEIYCLDGFLDGVVREDKSLICFECSGKERDSSLSEEPTGN